MSFATDAGGQADLQAVASLVASFGKGSCHFKVPVYGRAPDNLYVAGPSARPRP